MFKRAWEKKRRCIIPASGYYEWQDTPRAKQPWYFTAADSGPLLAIAGLYDEWTDRQTLKPLASCTMLITEPNAFVAEVHDRMPVLLQPSQFEAWLSGKAGKEILRPAPEDTLRKWSVSRRVNSSRAADDDEALIEEQDSLRSLVKDIGGEEGLDLFEAARAHTRNPPKS